MITNQIVIKCCEITLKKNLSKQKNIMGIYLIVIKTHTY